MQIQKIQSSPYFTSLNISPEAEKSAKGQRLDRAQEMLKNTEYVHVDLCGKDATPYIRTPYGSYSGLFLNVSTPLPVDDGYNGHAYEAKIEAFKTNNSFLNKFLPVYEQEIMRNEGKMENLGILFPNMRSYMNFYSRVKKSGDVYERAAIVAKTLDEMIKTEEEPLRLQDQKLPLDKPLIVKPVANDALGMDVSIGRIHQILKDNSNVRMEISERGAIPEIITFWGKYREYFKPFVPPRANENVLYIATIWGDKPTKLRAKYGKTVTTKNIDFGDSYILKLRFNSPEEAKKAYKTIENASNKYEQAAYVAKYMDKLCLGRIL